MACKRTFSHNNSNWADLWSQWFLPVGHMNRCLKVKRALVVNCAALSCASASFFAQAGLCLFSWLLVKRSAAEPSVVTTMCASTDGSNSKCARPVLQKMPWSRSTEPRGHRQRCKDSNSQGKSWCSWGRAPVLCCCLHVLVKLKSTSLHKCCVISTFIPQCTWEHPVPEVLSGCSLASCAVDVCECTRKQPGNRVLGAGFLFYSFRHGSKRLGMARAGAGVDVMSILSLGSACVPNPCSVGSLFVFLDWIKLLRKPLS